MKQCYVVRSNNGVLGGKTYCLFEEVRLERRRMKRVKLKRVVCIVIHLTTPPLCPSQPPGNGPPGGGVNSSDTADKR